MRVTPLRQWSPTAWISIASLWAAISGGLFLHGYWGFYGIEFWQYIGFTDVVQATLGVLIILVVVLAFTVALAIFYFPLDFLLDRLLEKLISLGKLSRTNTRRVLLVFGVLWITALLLIGYSYGPDFVRAFFARGLRANIVFGSICVVCLGAVLLALNEHLSALSPKLIVRIVFHAVILFPLVVPPLFGIAVAQMRHRRMLENDPALSRITARNFKEPTAFPSKRGYFVVGGLKDTVFLFDCDRRRILATSSAEIRMVELTPLLPSHVFGWPR